MLCKSPQVPQMCMALNYAVRVGEQKSMSRRATCPWLQYRFCYRLLNSKLALAQLLQRYLKLRFFEPDLHSQYCRMLRALRFTRAVRLGNRRRNRHLRLIFCYLLFVNRGLASLCLLAGSAAAHATKAVSAKVLAVLDRYSPVCCGTAVSR